MHSTLLYSVATTRGSRRFLCTQALLQLTSQATLKKADKGLVYQCKDKLIEPEEGAWNIEWAVTIQKDNVKSGRNVQACWFGSRTDTGIRG